jgi:WD40 repeat protein
LIWEAVEPRSLFQSKGRTLITYEGHGEYQVNAVAWSPEGKYIASGSEKQTTAHAETLQVWNANTGQITIVYRGHDDQSVYALAWSPEGKRIAIAFVGLAQVWEVATGKVLTTYRGHDSSQMSTSIRPRVDSIAWSPDGKYIASATQYDNSVAVWEAATGMLQSKYRHHCHGVCSISWSPDGKFIAIGSTDRGVYIWDVTTQVIRLMHSRADDRREELVVAWSSDGMRIASSLHNSIEIWDSLTGNTLFTYNGHPRLSKVDALAWSPDGKRIASGGTDRQIHVWEPK